MSMLDLFMLKGFSQAMSNSQFIWDSDVGGLVDTAQNFKSKELKSRSETRTHMPAYFRVL